MRALLSGTQDGVSPRIAEIVTESFGGFSVACLAVQCADGALDEARMDALIQFVEDNINCCAVRDGACRVYFLFEPTPGLSLEEIIRQYFDTLEGDLCVYVGVSGIYTNSNAVQAAMRQAQRRMLCADVPEQGERYSFSASETAHASGFDEAMSEKFVEAAISGDSDTASALLRQMIGEGRAQLYLLRGWIPALRAQITGHGGVIDDDTDDFYHPGYVIFRIMNSVRSVEPVEETPAEPVYDEFRERVLDYMKEHFTEDITLESVAERFHITSVHLSRWFKKANDINFSTYLSALRMNRACELLRNNPDMKIADVSLSVGIQNAATLTRQFKSFAGVTPEQFRRQCAMEDEKGR